MLLSRRRAARLLQRPYRFHLRGYADSNSSDPTTTNRSVDPKSPTEPQGYGDSSATNSEHAGSAGEFDPRDSNGLLKDPANFSDADLEALIKMARESPSMSPLDDLQISPRTTLNPIPRFGRAMRDLMPPTVRPKAGDESFGRGFYITIATLALSFALYKYSRSSSTDPSTAGELDKQPLITRLMHTWNYFEDRLTERNATHTAMVEQAGHDRNLFFGSQPSKHIDLKFPEVFNTGSPYNIPAGHAANLDELKEHYRKKNTDAQEKRIANLEAVTAKAASSTTK